MTQQVKEMSMNVPFAKAMSQALEQTRAGNPSEATRILQEVLDGATQSSHHFPPSTLKSVNARRPLGQVIDSLVNGRRLHAANQGPISSRPDMPNGARYEARRHESRFGTRDYRLFVPAPRDQPVRGLLLMLHGCTQNADDFAVGTQMNDHGERHGLIIIYAEQNRHANNMACWNWFRPGDQVSNQGEPALLTDLANRVAAEFAISSDRVFAAGFSAGAAMAAILGATHPETFDAVGVHSGLAPGSASDVASAYAAMSGQISPRRLPTPAAVRSIVFHGQQDSTVNVANAQAVISAALRNVPTISIDDDSVSGARCTSYRDTSGCLLAENWRLEDVGHAWSGGAPEGTYTCPSGPDASAEMVRFFLSGERRSHE